METRSADTVHDRIPQPQHCVCSPALTVIVRSFLELLHFYLPHSNDEPLYVASPRRRLPAGGCSTKTPKSISFIVLREKSTAFHCQARPGYPNLLEPAGSFTTRYHNASRTRATSHPHTKGRDWVGSVTVHPRAKHTFEKCIVRERERERRHSI